jgi:hypothetical protein
MAASLNWLFAYKKQLVACKKEEKFKINTAGFKKNEQQSTSR